MRVSLPEIWSSVSTLIKLSALGLWFKQVLMSYSPVAWSMASEAVATLQNVNAMCSRGSAFILFLDQVLLGYGMSGPHE